MGWPFGGLGGEEAGGHADRVGTIEGGAGLAWQAGAVRRGRFYASTTQSK